MVQIPAAFDGTLHLRDVLMLVPTTTDSSGMARLGEIVAALTSWNTVALRVKTEEGMADVRLSPEEAMYLSVALQRLAYRALDERKKT